MSVATSLPGWGSWSFQPIVILALAAAAVLYRRMYRRAAARSSSRAPGAGHWVPYGAGLLTIAVALLSPLDAIGDRYLLSAHMMQHVLLSDIAPALIDLSKYTGQRPPRFYVFELLVENQTGPMRPGMTGTARLYGRRRSLAGLATQSVGDFFGRKFW